MWKLSIKYSYTNQNVLILPVVVFQKLYRNTIGIQNMIGLNFCNEVKLFVKRLWSFQCMNNLHII